MRREQPTWTAPFHGESARSLTTVNGSSLTPAGSGSTISRGTSAPSTVSRRRLPISLRPDSEHQAFQPAVSTEAP